MKVLLVFDMEKSTDNLFAPILCRSIRRQGIDIHCSLRDFWEDNSTRYQIIHFQWPEIVVGWMCADPAVIRKLRERLEHFRTQGCRFVYTRHNERPHYRNSLIEQAYHLIESYSDTVVHMGAYSRRSFSREYPAKNNVIIPHHIYEHTYNETISRKDARLRLHLPQDGVIVTAFGKFRNKEEIFMVLKGFRRFKENRKILVAPRMLPFNRHPWQRNPLKRVLSFVGYYLAPLYLRTRHVRAGMSEELLSNESLAYYLAASDIVLIQRGQILNSGNVPLAFLFRRIVVGPAAGNVEEWLQSTGNPTFDPSDAASIGKALREAALLIKTGKGEENYQYALREMSLRKVADMYIKAYRQLAAE